MTLRRLGFGCVLVWLLSPAVVSADEHRAGLFAGFSDLKGSNLLGAHFTGDFAPLYQGHAELKRLSVIGDFSVNHGTHQGADVTIKTGLIGGGYEIPMGHSKQAIAGQALLGWVSGAGDNGTLALGALYEYLPHHGKLGWQWGVRVQYDHLNRKGEQNFHRVSVGIAFRDKTK